jgi:hypothetical protein
VSRQFAEVISERIIAAGILPDDEGLAAIRVQNKHAAEQAREARERARARLLASRQRNGRQ